MTDKQLTPTQDLIEWIIKYEKINKVFPNGQECMFQAELLEEKEKQVNEDNENLLDEIHACIGNEFRLPQWIEAKLNNRFRRLLQQKQI